MTTTRWTTLATATLVAVGVALVSVGSPVGATTKRTKRATTTTVEKRPLRTDSRPPTSGPETTRPDTTRPDTTSPDRTSTEAPKIETSSSTPEPSKPTRLETVSSAPAQTEPPRTSVPKLEPPRTEPPKTEPPKTEPPKTEPLRTEPPRTVPTSQPPTSQPPAAQPSTEIRTPSTLGLRCTVVERNVRCEWSGETNGAVRYLLLRGHSGDTAGRVIGPFDLSVHSAIDVAPTSKLTFNYLVIAQDASGKNAAHSDPVSVTIP